MEKIAIIIPVYNEEYTIESVIMDFYNENPDSMIYIINNNSSDNTESIARTTMRINSVNGSVINVSRQGKANAVREAFRVIESDIYVIVDGDATYLASDLKNLIKPVKYDGYDMVVGNRFHNSAYDLQNKRVFHSFGNKLVRKLINVLFNANLVDIMSGYRTFSKQFIKNYPILCEGFELETEMTLHALDHSFLIKEIPIRYEERVKGSKSKLNTISDGFKVLKKIILIFKDYKPFKFFFFFSILSLVSGLIIGVFPIIEYIEFKYIYKVPSAILATGLIILSLLFFSIGVILDTIVRYQKFNYELQLNKSLNNK